jgi:hypothetical protein
VLPLHHVIFSLDILFGFYRGHDCIVEIQLLVRGSRKCEVDVGPGCNGVLACGYAVSIFCVVGTELRGCATQSTDNAFPCRNNRNVRQYLYNSRQSVKERLKGENQHAFK